MRLLRRDVHALAGVYALDALDPGAERDWFSRHLNRCQSCASGSTPHAVGIPSTTESMGMSQPANMRQQSPPDFAVGA